MILLTPFTILLISTISSAQDYPTVYVDYQQHRYPPSRSKQYRDVDDYPLLIDATQEYSDYDPEYSRPTRSQETTTNDNFVRFGRNDNDFVRFGRGRRDSVKKRVQFWRTFGTHRRNKRNADEGEKWRRGSSASSFLRFGREQLQKLLGKAEENIKRDSNAFLRFGRDRQAFLQFGQSDTNNFLRFGRTGQSNNFLRFGRGDNTDNFAPIGCTYNITPSTTTSTEFKRFRGSDNNFFSFGRGNGDKFMRFGKSGNYTEIKRLIKKLKGGED